MAAPQLFNRVRAEGQVDMKNGRLTQWIAKYGYVPIVLIGMAGLAPEIGAGERKSGDTIVVEAPVVAEPASKGYIYANSPTHWTPVPLPNEIISARPTHNNNIRAEIEQAAMLFNVDVRMMKAFARIEFWLQPESHDRQIQVPVPTFRLGVCQVLAWRHLRHTRLLDRGGQKGCD